MILPRLGGSYGLLIATTLMWGGNAVASRLAVGEVSPMLLTALRWAIVLVLLGVAAGRTIRAEWPALRVQWRLLLAMGACGFTGFNALFYVAAHHTTAVNISIIQGSIPVFVLLGGLVLHRTPVRGGQAVGVALTLGGVGLIASGGEITRLAALRLNMGDVLMVAACLAYAGYTLGLRRRGAASGLAFFAGLAIAAFISATPLAVAEALAGSAQWPTAKGWLILTYIGLLPSFLAQLLFMRAVERIGPGRAGLFINLVPVFGSGLGVVVLNEPFGAFHAGALGLVLAGIGVAEWSARGEAERAGGEPG